MFAPLAFTKNGPMAMPARPGIMLVLMGYFIRGVFPMSRRIPLTLAASVDRK